MNDFISTIRLLQSGKNCRFTALHRQLAPLALDHIGPRPFFLRGKITVRKNSESDPSEVKRTRLVAKRNDIYGNINSRLV